MVLFIVIDTCTQSYPHVLKHSQYYVVLGDRCSTLMYRQIHSIIYYGVTQQIPLRSIHSYPHIWIHSQYYMVWGNTDTLTEYP